MRLYIDTETKSKFSIKDGIYKYHEGSQLLLISYAIDDEDVKVVDVANNEPIPADLANAMANAGEIWAHNAMFDRVILSRYYPQMADIRRWRDSMVLAYSLSMPGALGTLCDILKLDNDTAKDKDGKRLIQIFCVGNDTKATKPDDWAKFVNYARLDIESMRTIIKRFEWIAEKDSTLWPLWHIDQKINDRGIFIDLDLVYKTINLLEKAKVTTDANIAAMTNGVAQTAGQRNKLISFIQNQYGISIDALTKSTVERILADDSTPEPVKDLLIERQKGSKTSVSKYTALKDATNCDWRLRGTLQYMGAGRTGRWTGKKFQPQNLPRGTMKPDEVETAINAIKAGTAEFIYPDISSVASSCIRGCICAPQGKKLVVADLSNIEGRVLAWIAGEDWKIQAFRDFDNGKGEDLYKLAYSRSFGISPKDVTKHQRQIGKVMELGLGYEGGVGAFVTFATAYNLDLDTLAELTLKTADRTLLNEASTWYTGAVVKKLTQGLSQNQFIACDTLKRAWRRAHPHVCELWAFMDDAVRAIASGSQYTLKYEDKITVFKKANSLFIRLPSGRCLHYPGIHIDNSNKIAYFGLNQTTNRWTTINTYGGKLTENVVQATARDVLASALIPADEQGYHTTMSVHDELITETEDRPEFNAEALAKIMSTQPSWAKDLPLAAAGFESYRYKKD